MDSPCGKKTLKNMPEVEREAFLKTAEKLDKDGYLNKGKIVAAGASKWANKTFDVMFENYMGKLLSNRVTQLGSVTGNTVMVMTHVAEKLLSVPISKAMLDGPEGVSWAEGYAAVRGMAVGLSEARAFANAAIEHVSNSEKSIAENMGLPEALNANTKLFEMNAAITSDNWENPNTWAAVAVKRYGQLARLPGQLLTGGDLYFKMVNFYMAMEEGATREAMLAFREAQKTDPSIEFDKQKFQERVSFVKGYAMENPDDPIAKKAVALADENTFVSRPHTDIARKVTETPIWGLRWFMPIKKVPINAAARAWERTLPALVTDSRIHAEVTSDDPAVSSMALSKVAMGTMLTGAIMATFEANLTGTAPRDPTARGLWEQDGYKEHAFTFRFAGADPVHVPFKLFGPLEPVLKALADAKQVMNLHSYIERNPDAIHGKLSDVNSMFEELVWTTANAMIGNLWMTDIKEALDTVMELLEHGEKRKTLKFFAEKLSTSLVGNAMYQQGTKRADPIRREAYTVWARLFRRFPFISKQFPPVIGFWGEEVPWARDMNPDFSDGLDLYDQNTQPAHTDPVVVELRKIHYKIPEMTRDHMNVKFNDEEFTQYKRFAGQGLYQALKVRMTMPDWSKKAAKGRNVRVLPTDHARRTRIDSVVKAQRAKAVAQILGNKNSQFRKDIKQFNTNEAKYQTKVPAGRL